MLSSRPGSWLAQQETLAGQHGALQQQLQSLANNNRQQNPNAANQIRAAANELGNNQTALTIRSARRDVLGIAAGPEGTADRDLQNRAYYYARERQEEVRQQLARCSEQP